MIGVAVLGSTGSVGVSTLDVLARHPQRFRVTGLAAQSNVERLLSQCSRHRPDLVSVASPDAALQLEQRLRAAGLATRVVAGAAAADEVATAVGTDYVMAAISGAAGLSSTLAAARAGRRVLLANKESIVMAGPLLLAALRAGGGDMIPIDSEHNAIFQCLPAGWEAGTRPAGVRRLLLTASGGPFLDWPAEALERVTPQQACAHPRWQMGRKISVDSATLLNKGLELIEASVLFGMPADDIEVLVHPQSIVHSLVQYEDGSMLAQLGTPDMRTPIAQALAWPERIGAGVEFLDLARAGTLEFRPPDPVRFPCLALALAAARAGAAAAVRLNAADEVAVQAFLDKRLNFGDIPRVIGTVMDKLVGGIMSGLEAVWAADAEARALAAEAVVCCGAAPVRSRGVPA